MATQKQAAQVYADLQAQTAEQVSADVARTTAQLITERTRLAEIREARETRREIGAEMVHLNEEDRGRMGLVVWVLAGLLVLFLIVAWGTWLWAKGW